MAERVVVTGLDRMIEEFDQLSKGVTYQTVGKFEEILSDAFLATQAAVHVLSGGLKGSGVPMSSFDGDVWQCEIEYDRSPGIFELSLGDEPSIFHPEGAHADFLTKAVEPADRKIGEALDAVFEDAFHEKR